MLNEILKHKVISFVGSGGKTTLMFALAKKLSLLGKKVIVTTTTKIYIPQNHPVVLPDKDIISMSSTSRSLESLKEIMASQIELSLNSDNICVTGSLCLRKDHYEPQKLCSYELCGFSARDFLSLADFVLIEADGSKHKPLKFPGENEPVIPIESDLVIAVAAMWCAGQAISQVCHRYELACRFLSSQYGYEISKDHIVTREDVMRIMNSKSGYRKNVGDRAFLKYIFYNEDDYADFEI